MRAIAPGHLSTLRCDRDPARSRQEGHGGRRRRL